MLSVSNQFTLGKNERLKSRKQIEKLFAEGKSFVVGPFRVYFIINDIPKPIATSMVNNPLQFGVGVSSKNFKKAVDRNRIKRLTREAWRLQKNNLKEIAKSSGKQIGVFFIYTGKEKPVYNFVYDKMKTSIEKLIKIFEQQRET